MEDYVNKTIDPSFYEPVKIRKFTIPIGETKKRWQFWKKSEKKKAKKAIKELMTELKQAIDFSCTDVKIPEIDNVFISDPTVIQFINYCKEKYTEKIERISLELNTEHNSWQMIVREGTPGLIWVPWKIQTHSTLCSCNKNCTDSDKTIKTDDTKED